MSKPLKVSIIWAYIPNKTTFPLCRSRETLSSPIIWLLRIHQDIFGSASVQPCIWVNDPIN